MKLRMGFAKQDRMYCMTCDAARINVIIICSKIRLSKKAEGLRMAC